MKRQLILENGEIFVGNAFGSERFAEGEVVFHTGMTGYQEIVSDPSFCGQIVTLTYPLVGNYGINRDDFESMKLSISGLIVKEASKFPSNWRSETSIHELLKEYDIPGLEGIDTRRLTRVIRSYGTLRGKICAIDEDIARVVSNLKHSKHVRNQVSLVSTKTSYSSPGHGLKVVLMDFGMKKGILRELHKRQCDVVVVPYNTSVDEILRLNPDGILLSNGPGDPTDLPEVIETIKCLLGSVPIFGICLGHQLLALASGAKTIKLSFGHRGSNHPVKEIKTGNIIITSQNHGYAVERNSIKDTRLAITHLSLNDGTVEGIEHLDYSAFSVQYHPEASPGPNDANGGFDHFVQLMSQHTIVGLRGE